MFKRLLISALSFLAISASATPLLGSTVNFQYYFPDLSSPYNDGSAGNYVVGSGVEVASISGVASVDITATQIRVDYNTSTSWSSAAFNGFRLTDVFGLIDAWTITLDPSSNLAGLTADRITFGDDFLQVNWQGLSFDANTLVVFNITTQNVPEPGSLALVGLGLVGIVAMRKRKV